MWHKASSRIKTEDFVIIMWPWGWFCVWVGGIMEPWLIGVDQVRDTLNITQMTH